MKTDTGTTVAVFITTTATAGAMYFTLIDGAFHGLLPRGIAGRLRDPVFQENRGADSYSGQPDRLPP